MYVHEVYGHNQGPACTSAQEAQCRKYSSHEVYGIDPVHQGLISCEGQIRGRREQAQGCDGFIVEGPSVRGIAPHPKISGLVGQFFHGDHYQ